MAPAIPWKRFKSTAKQQEQVEDGDTNPLNGKPFSAKYKLILARKREVLPVCSRRQEFLDAFHDEKDVVILSGATGSGKTTQIPQYAMWDCDPLRLAERGDVVVCTQPRVWACESVAQRVADELDVKLGTAVGFQHGKKICATDETPLQFATDGMIIGMANRDQLLPRFACVIVDEAHERTYNTDLLLTVLKKAVKLRRKAGWPLKVIVMSASMNLDLFSRYFGCDKAVQIPGQTFDVAIKYSLSPVDDPMVTAAQVVVDLIHPHRPSGDILVFAPGSGDIDRIIKAIQKRPPEGLLCIKAMARMTPDEQKAIDEDAPMRPDGQRDRKVVVATNVAETSITIPGLKYVVDTGRIKYKVYDPIQDLHYLLAVPISQANAIQRRGRVGRTAPGEVFRLYTEDQYYTDMDDQPPADVVKQGAEEYLMHVLKFGEDPFDFDMVESPSTPALLRAVDDFYWLGLLEEDSIKFPDKKSSNHSKAHVAAQLSSVDPRLAVAMHNSTAPSLGCSTEICAIAAMVQVTEARDVWMPKPPKKQGDALQKWLDAKRSMSHWTGDHISYLIIYHYWLHAKAKYRGAALATWCKDNCLQIGTLRIVDTAYTKLFEAMVGRAGLKALALKYDDPLWVTKILRCLCKVYFKHSAMAIGGGLYRRPEHEYIMEYDSDRTFLGGDTDDRKWVIFGSVTQLENKKLMDNVTIVSPGMLIAACPAYFSPFSLLDGVAESDGADNHYGPRTSPSEELFKFISQRTGIPLDQLRVPRLQQLDGSE